MPELPEVESVRRRLAPVLEGRTLERVEIIDARLTRPFAPDEVARELEGERVAAVDRRGKYLIVRFESGRALLIHLRMTGSLRHLTAAATRSGRSLPSCGCHIRRRIGRRLSRRPAVRHLAAARAGRGRALPRRARRPRAARARRSAHGSSAPARRPARAGEGGDPRPAHARRRREHLRRRGALARADPPAARGAEPRPSRGARAPQAIREALEHGIARQGSTLRDYALPDGGSGGMQHEFKVYGAGAASRATAAGRRSRRSASAGPRHVVLPVVPALDRLELAGRSPPRLAGGAHVQDRGDRAALAALLRGRPDPAPLHARPRPDRRDRKGDQEDEVPLRRAARAALARRARAARGLRRAADGDRRRADRLAPRRPARTPTG